MFECLTAMAVSPTASWSELAAGPAGATSLAAVAALDPAALSGAAVVDAIVATEKAWSLLAARRHQLRARLAEPFVAGDPTRLAVRLAGSVGGDLEREDSSLQAACVAEAARSMAASAIAAALRIPTRTAGAEVTTAVEMTTVLAPTLAALQDGQIDPVGARIVQDATVTAGVPTSVTAAVQDLVLPGADELTRTEFRERVAAAVITVDPRGAQERHDQATARRELRLTAAADAMATLTAHLPAAAGVTVFQLCDLLATQTAGQPGDGRGVGARRVDALIDLADTLLTHGCIDLRNHLGHHPDDENRESTTSTGTVDRCTCGGRNAPSSQVATRQGRRPHLTVTIAASTLAGADDLPGSLAGFGPIPAVLARAIATSAGTITALAVDDATGTPVAAGALTYRPRQATRDRATALHGHCRFPSCRQPAWRCDLDHRDPFDHHHPDRGGPTAPENLQVLCRRHHLTKHHTDWRVEPDRDHIELIWTSPTGHRYTSRGRTAAIPDSWLAHAGTAVLDLRTPGRPMADDLDQLARSWPHPAGDTHSLEPSLADRMIAHAINHHRCGGLLDPAITTLGTGRYESRPVAVGLGDPPY